MMNEKAVSIFSEYFENPGMTSSGRTYLKVLYHLAIAYEGLNETEKANEVYREILKFWDNTDIQIKYIEYAREYLSREVS
ncbi:MAG: hypothetical protein V3V99_10995 [candidate division Zixibacteria bacterium]